jgi:glycosyltransferase involved in cell wall biosynthesis
VKLRSRLAYVSGWIDAEQVYRDYRERRASSYFGTIYFAQLLEDLDRLGAEALVVSTLPSGRWRRDLDGVTVVNIPMPAWAGPAYYLGMMLWTARCIREIVRFRPCAALLTAGQDYFWMYRRLSFSGIRLMTSLHCSLWPKLAEPRLHQRLFAWLNGMLFYPACDHIQGVSQDILDQVVAVSRKLRALPRKFVPTYDRARFSAVTPPTLAQAGQNFNLLYVGRLEANKGIFDLLQMMQQLQAAQPGRFFLDFCGTGAAHDQLVREVAAAELGKVVRVNGDCDSETVAEKYRQSHVVIVPTRSDFEEGYAKVVAEAVINLRPVITSAACPALADVRPAALEARVDDAADYASKVLMLADDPELFAEKCRGAEECREIYFDQAHSYGAVIEPALRRLLQQAKVPRGTTVTPA